MNKGNSIFEILRLIRHNAVKQIDDTVALTASIEGGGLDFEAVTEVLSQLLQVMGTPKVAAEWFVLPQSIFNGKTPLEMMDTVEGVGLVSQLLGRLANGVFS